MAKNIPTLKEWKRLYDAIIRVKEIEPWHWMEEADVFGVQEPDSEKIGFVSVMGLLGEHYAVAVYLDQEGLYGFWRLQESIPDDIFGRLLEIPQLQASFESRNYLEKRDRSIIKKLGLQFRGRQAWPCFRSYRPGFFPWFIEADEARFLTHALEQTIDVALRFRDDRALFIPPDDESYLVRVSHMTNEKLHWEDRTVHVPPPEPYQVVVEVDKETIGALKSFPARTSVLEIDYFSFPARIGRKGSRPVCPYMLLIVDGKAGLVLGHELLTIDRSEEKMLGSIPEHVARYLLKLGGVPQEIKVTSEMMYMLLGPLAEELGFKLTPVRRLRELDAAREAMFKHLG